MPQTFGTTSQRCRLFDPAAIPAERRRFLRPEVPDVLRANSLYVPGGRQPATGWLLLLRSEFQVLVDSGAVYATDLTLQLDEAVSRQQAANPRSITLGGLSVVQAQSVTTGITSDAAALYLVQVTDARGVLSNRWVQFPTNSYYNVRSPAYPQEFYDETLDAGLPWTWAGMVQDLWEQMPLLGPFPGLPVAPSGTPEGWALPGVPCWRALCDVLDHLGCTVAVDLTAAAPYTIADNGAADPALATLQATALAEDRLQDDAGWIDRGSARVPGLVVVCFHVRYDEYGTEETVRQDAPQWFPRGVYEVPVAAPAAFTGAQGTHLLWDDFQPRFDRDGVIFPADAATAAAIAVQRTTQYYNYVYSGTAGFLRQIYAGLLPFATGPQCDGVAWVQDREARIGKVRVGWRTTVVRGADPVFGELESMGQK